MFDESLFVDKLIKKLEELKPNTPDPADLPKGLQPIDYWNNGWQSGWAQVLEVIEKTKQRS